MAKTLSFKSLHRPRLTQAEEGKRYPCLWQIADLNLFSSNPRAGVSNERLEAGYVELGRTPRGSRRWVSHLRAFPVSEAGLARARAHLRGLGFEAE